MGDKITVYVPDNSVKKGYLSLFREMAKEVRDAKWLTWQLFKRDFKAVYQQSVMGILWVIIPPIVTIGTFFLLNQAGVFDVGDLSVPYPIYAFLGMALWGLIAGGIPIATRSLVSAGGMITKINFPREALVVSSLGKTIVTFLIQIIAVAVFFVWYGIYPHWMTIFVPFMLIPIILLVLGAGFILSIMNSVVRDIAGGIGMAITFLMFMTPILYADTQTGFLATLTQYNPLYYLVVVPRDLILTGGTALWNGYMLSVLLSIGIFFLGWLIFHLTETRIAERI